MKVVTLISWFDKETEELVGEYDLGNISLEVLKRVFDPREEDPLLYEPYWISKKEADELKKYLELPIIFEFDKYDYDLGRYQAKPD
ncbi:MAG: hypothetical protein ROO71_08320 [Balneola sp.]